MLGRCPVDQRTTRLNMMRARVVNVRKTIILSRTRFSLRVLLAQRDQHIYGIDPADRRPNNFG